MKKPHYRVLIAEDEKNVLAYLVGVLTKQGYTVDATANGKQALEQIAKHKPDLLITDGVMPEMTGFELTRLIRSNDATKDIPILFCSAASQEDLKEKGVKADIYLHKPLDIEEFCAAVAQLLGG